MSTQPAELLQTAFFPFKYDFPDDQGHTILRLNKDGFAFIRTRPQKF